MFVRGALPFLRRLHLVPASGQRRPLLLHSGRHRAVANFPPSASSRVWGPLQPRAEPGAPAGPCTQTPALSPEGRPPRAVEKGPGTGDTVCQTDVTVDTQGRFHNVSVHKHKQKSRHCAQSSAPVSQEVRGTGSGQPGRPGAAGKQGTGTASRRPPPDGLWDSGQSVPSAVHSFPSGK